MTLRLRPYYNNGGEILSLLFLGDAFFCYALHRSDKDYPAGIYILQKRHSPKLKRDVIWITNVPGHEYMYFHSGNTIKDTEGCILLGSITLKEPAQVSMSKGTLNTLENILMPLLNTEPRCTLIVEEMMR